MYENYTDTWLWLNDGEKISIYINEPWHYVLIVANNGNVLYGTAARHPTLPMDYFFTRPANENEIGIAERYLELKKKGLV
jgi:predicted carbohydrate-binding protein with CBM5 and CBM33 domain